MTVQYKCPQCGEDNLCVEATSVLSVYIDKDGDIQDTRDGDPEWNDDSPARCCDCNFSGQVKQFERIVDDN